MIFQRMFLKFDIFYVLYINVLVTRIYVNCVYIYKLAVCRGQKRGLDPLGLELPL